jgi:hypothetical protein
MTVLFDRRFENVRWEQIVIEGVTITADTNP